MVSFEDKLIRLGEKLYKITGFEVWFSTPRGLSKNIDEAVKVCNSLDCNPELAIKPVSVAVTDQENVYELI